MGRQSGREDQWDHRAQPRIANAPGAGRLRKTRDRSGEYPTDRSPWNRHEIGRPDRSGRTESVLQKVYPEKRLLRPGLREEQYRSLLDGVGNRRGDQAPAGAEAQATAAYH